MSRSVKISLGIIILIVAVIALMAVIPVNAADTPAQTQMKDAVTGTMDIQFNTRTNVDDKGNPQQGATDNYKTDLVIVKSLGLNGTIQRQPQVQSSGLIARALRRGGQAAQFQYDLNWRVINVADPSKSVEVGKWVGVMPIDAKTNAFVLDGSKDFPLRNDVRKVGRADAFKDMFAGKVYGKAVDKTTLLDKVLTRTVGGKTVSTKVQKADPLRFENVALAAGPAAIYGRCTVNGSMIYSYETADYFIDNVTFTYTANNKEVTDRVNGTIHWAKDTNYDSNGKSRYEFNVRFNEPQKDESAALQATQDEAAFFAVDPSASTLLGAIEFQDTKTGDSVSASKIVYKLEASGLNKEQVVNFMKLWMLIVGPTNDE